MRKSGLRIGARLALSTGLAALLWGSLACAGPWEDGMVAYNRGDYLPAIRLFEPLARQGKGEAQKILARIYRRSDPAHRSVRALMWWEIAASQGDAEAVMERDQLEREMPADQVENARALAQACLASHYKRCR